MMIDRWYFQNAKLNVARKKQICDKNMTLLRSTLIKKLEELGYIREVVNITNYLRLKFISSVTVSVEFILINKSVCKRIQTNKRYFSYQLTRIANFIFQRYALNLHIRPDIITSEIFYNFTFLPSKNKARASIKLQ